MKRIALILVLFGCFAGSAFGASNAEIFDRVIDYAAKNSCGDARWYADIDLIWGEYERDPNTNGRIYTLRRQTEQDRITFARVYVNHEGYPDECEKIRDYVYQKPIFSKTKAFYPYYADMNSICREEFGADFRMADWADIEYMYAKWGGEDWIGSFRGEYQPGLDGYTKMMNDFGRQELNQGWISVNGERIAPQASSGGAGHYHISVPYPYLDMIKILGESRLKRIGYRASEDSGHVMCVKREDVPAPQIKPVPAPATQKVEHFPFRLTKTLYSATEKQVEQINNACAKEFGSSSRLAHYYHDILPYRTGMSTLDGFVKKLNAPNRQEAKGAWAFVGGDGYYDSVVSDKVFKDKDRRNQRPEGCFTYIGSDGDFEWLTKWMGVDCARVNQLKNLPVLCFVEWPE